MKPLAALLFLLALAGCATAPHPASVANGTCKVFEAPQYAVKGKKQYDQDWIDSTVEGGVGACGWQRPAARPAEVEKGKAAPKAAKKPAKPKWLSMLHGLRKPTPAAPVSETPAPAVPEAEAPPPASPAPAPEPKPLRPIDQLLGRH